jgi:hypothetical protein
MATSLGPLGELIKKTVTQMVFPAVLDRSGRSVVETPISLDSVRVYESMRRVVSIEALGLVVPVRETA